MPVQILPSFTTTSRVPVCSMCGSGPGKTNPNDSESPDRTVLGLGVDIDMEGTFDICWNCAETIGAEAGMVPEQRITDTVARYQSTAQDLERTKEELATVRGALSALREEARFHERREADALAEGFAAGQGSGT